MDADLERVRALAKALAKLEGATSVIYANGDGTYGFCLAGEAEEKQIVEYISEH